MKKTMSFLTKKEQKTIEGGGTVTRNFVIKGEKHKLKISKDNITEITKHFTATIGKISK
jgi:hypothetical protein